MPRPDVEWNPSVDNDADHHWMMTESHDYQDVVTGLATESLEGVSLADWEEANFYPEKGPHTGRIHRS